MSCLLPLKSKTSGSSPSPHRRGEKNNSKKQCNAVPPTHPPQPLHQVNSREEPSNAEPEKPCTKSAWQTKPAEGLWPQPFPHLLPGPYLLLHFFLVAETKHLSPYAHPSLRQVPYATFSPRGPNVPGSGEEGFRNQPVFFTPCPGMTIFRLTKPTTLSWDLTWRNKSGWDHQRPHSRLVNHQEGQENYLVSIPTKLFATEHIRNNWGFFLLLFWGFFVGGAGYWPLSTEIQTQTAEFRRWWIPIDLLLPLPAW